MNYAHILDTNEKKELTARMQALTRFVSTSRLQEIGTLVDLVENESVLEVVHDGNCDTVMHLENDWTADFTQPFWPEQKYRYNTSRHGGCRRYTNYFFASDTGFRDRNNRTIYVMNRDASGKELRLPVQDRSFVCKIYHGCPEAFGEVVFDKPAV